MLPQSTTAYTPAIGRTQRARYIRRGPGVFHAAGNPAKKLPNCDHSPLTASTATALDAATKAASSSIRYWRAEIIARALERERRREMAARDAAILAETGEDPELAGLIRYVTGHPVDPDR